MAHTLEIAQQSNVNDAFKEYCRLPYTTVQDDVLQQQLTFVDQYNNLFVLSEAVNESNADFIQKQIERGEKFHFNKETFFYCIFHRNQG